MSNLTVYGGTLSRIPAAAGAILGSSFFNIVKTGVKEAVTSRKVEAISGQIAEQVSTEVVRKISENMITNPEVISELVRIIGPLIGDQLVQLAMKWLIIQYQKHYYSIWAIIYTMATLAADWLLLDGSIARKGRNVVGRSFRMTVSKSAQVALKNARVVAKTIMKLKNPRSGFKKTQVLILFIFMFGLIMSTTRPIAGTFISMVGPYLTNRALASRANAGRNRASPNRASPNRASPKRASPNRASPKRASPNRASPKRASPNRANAGRVVSLAGSTRANNASRARARASRFGTMTNAQRMMGRLARFGPAN